MTYKEGLAKMAELNNEVTYPVNCNLCERASCMMINHLFGNKDNSSLLFVVLNRDYANLTPIEQIFLVAYDIYCCDFCDYETSSTPIRFNMALTEEIVPQRTIEYKDHKYIVDFCIDFSRKNLAGDKFVYEKLKKLKYIVEVDGYDYHSSKQQMQHDYERENNLKQLGYNVIRFTGSQVYNTPYECVNKLVKIIVKDIQRESD